MSFRKIYTQDREIQVFQDNVDDALKPLYALPVLGSSLITNISLIAGQDNLVAHKLKANPTMWTVAGLDSNSVLWSPASSQLSNQNSNSSFINIRCSANCVASFLFS